MPRFVLGWLAIVDLTLAAFDLLPAFPMNGGRILRALLARSRPCGTATRIAARIGVGFAFLLAIVGVLSFQIILLLLAFFIYGAATTESKAVLLDELFEGLTVSDVVTRDPATVSATTTVEEIMRDVPRIDPSADAFDTLVELQGSGGLDAIVQRDGDLVDVLSEADYAHAMTIQRGFRSGISG